VLLKNVKFLTTPDLPSPMAGSLTNVWHPYATNALESRKLPSSLCLAENVVFSTGAYHSRACTLIFCMHLHSLFFSSLLFHPPLCRTHVSGACLQGEELGAHREPNGLGDHAAPTSTVTSGMCFQAVGGRATVSL
jgi:hypothetical protein